MADEPQKPETPRRFRRVAAVVAVTCFILAAVLSFVPVGGDMRLGVYGCVAMGVAMAACAYWG